MEEGHSNRLQKIMAFFVCMFSQEIVIENYRHEKDTLWPGTHSCCVYCWFSINTLRQAQHQRRRPDDEMRLLPEQLSGFNGQATGRRQ